MESSTGSTIPDARQQRDASFRGARYGQLLTHLSVSFLVVPQKGKPGSSRDPFATKRIAARRTLRFRSAVQMGSPTGGSGVMAGKVVVVTAARLAWEGQPFVLFHILPVVPRGLRSPLSSFSELSFCFF